MPELIYSPKRKLFVLGGLSLCGIALVLIWAMLFPVDGMSSGGLPRFLGRFHPLALHFPVVCLLLAAISEIAGLHIKTRFFAKVRFPMLLVGAFSAVITVMLGLMLASTEGHQGELISRHRAGGIVVAVLSCLTLLLYCSAKHMTKFRYYKHAYRFTLTCSVVAMMLTAHDGGSLVHGEGYLAEHAPEFLKKVLQSNKADKYETESHQNPQNSDKVSAISSAVLDRYEQELSPFIKAYCARCHGAGKQEANVRLDTLDPAFMQFSSQYEWQKVLDVLGAHRMPPDDAKQPSDAKRAQAITWIRDALHEHAYAKRAERKASSIRRLSRRELNYTYQDLFGVDADFATHLPSDAKSLHGYDTDANTLLVSMSDLKAYQEMARQAVSRYVEFASNDKRDTKQTDYYLVEMEDIYHYCRLEGDKLSYERAPAPMPFYAFEQAKMARQNKVAEYRYRDYGPLPFGQIPVGDVRGLGEGRGFARAHEQFMLIKTRHRVGEVVVNVHSATTGDSSGKGSRPKLRVEAGWRKEQSLRVKVVGEDDITAPLSSPQQSEFRFRLEDVVAPASATFYDENSEYNWLLLVFSNYARHEKGALGGSIYGQIDMNLASAQHVVPTFITQAANAKASQAQAEKAWREAQLPVLKLDAVEISITPVQEDQSSPFVIPAIAGMSEQEERKLVEQSLKKFLERAFRRLVSTTELADYFGLYKDLRRQGDSFKTALRETLAASLISPEFLYIGFPTSIQGNEQPAMQNVSYPLDHENHANSASSEEKNNYSHQVLASKLSYFLWSSMPDKRLRQLAHEGRLNDPYVLSTEVDRMLDDPKSRRMSADFVKQWLQLDKFDNITVAGDKFPEYGDELGQSMIQQSILRFQDNFHQNQDARKLYFSDHMILNKVLARHYGIENFESGEFDRVTLPNTDDSDWIPPNLGLMTHASVLTINSDGEDSHPIKRGVWLLERVFNEPPPPPPPSVPDLDPNNPLLAGLSLKQKIEQHRALSACSGCHEKIDPWGVLLENYDALGRWRDTTETEQAQSVPVDASSILPDGTEVNSLLEFRVYLRDEREEKLMKAIVHHMMLYALGRELDILDEKEAEAIYSSFRASGYRLSALTKAIVQSDAFTNREQG
ncbi:DUF1592 domain-containing protein [Agaribacter flavus]|uniref:DUF1592 domain-containing protein n=1 Tax=Agaribacter flavus TaxID=1902781 RepID=A0ABV7FTU3_9ALTE